MLHAIAPAGVYEIAGRRLDIDAPHFAEAIANAHSTHQRPRCMCQAQGVEMYVARLTGPTGGYIVKRMPDTGYQHAVDCPSYEPPADASGLGQVLGSAITEDPATGETTLKLDFSLSKMPGRSAAPPSGANSDSVASTGTKLSLRGLLHYLWDQAELTRWHPGFAGKRNWATVRRHLLQAAEHKQTRGDALSNRLYVPEPFTVEEREAINARRLAQWQAALPTLGKPQQLMLLIGEVKEIVPARYGFKAIVKHLPDQAFAVEEQLYRRLGRRFEQELALWGASDDIQMVMIATFAVSSAGVPTIHELCLMPANRQWLPVADEFEKQLLQRLVAKSRAFIKGLAYNLGEAGGIARATLIDCEGATPVMRIVPPSPDEADPSHEAADPLHAAWAWRPSNEAMPPFPPART